MKQANFPLMQMHNHLLRKAKANLDEDTLANDTRLAKELEIVTRLNQAGPAGEAEDEPHTIEIPPTTYMKFRRIAGAKVVECHGCTITTRFPNNFVIVKTPRGARKVLVVEDIEFDAMTGLRPILCGRTFMTQSSLYKIPGVFDFKDDDCYKVSNLSSIPSKWYLEDALVGKGFPIDLSVDGSQPLAVGQPRPAPNFEAGEWVVQKMMHFRE